MPSKFHWSVMKGGPCRFAPSPKIFLVLFGQNPAIWELLIQYLERNVVLKSHFYTEQSLMTTFIDLILIKNFIPEFIICHFSLLCYMPLIKSPKQRLETYWFCSVSYYYYITLTAVGWCIVILCFFFNIIIIIPHIFVRSISRRCLDQTLWNLVGISYAMWSWSFKGWFFQNGCRCHGNGQNAKINWKTQKWS